MNSDLEMKLQTIADELDQISKDYQDKIFSKEEELLKLLEETKKTTEETANLKKAIEESSKEAIQLITQHATNVEKNNTDIEEISKKIALIKNEATELRTNIRKINNTLESVGDDKKVIDKFVENQNELKKDFDEMRQSISSDKKKYDEANKQVKDIIDKLNSKQKELQDLEDSKVYRFLNKNASKDLENIIKDTVNLLVEEKLKSVNVLDNISSYVSRNCHVKHESWVDYLKIEQK